MDSDVELEETLILDAAGFRLTGDGYLVATPRIARTGIQIYRGYEVGRPDMEDVRVYRPEQEVFSHAAMATLAHRPITLDHPFVSVDATNWKEYSIGHSSGEVARDGDFLRVPLVLMDANAIQAAQDRHVAVERRLRRKAEMGTGRNAATASSTMRCRRRSAPITSRWSARRAAATSSRSAMIFSINTRTAATTISIASSRRRSARRRHREGPGHAARRLPDQERERFAQRYPGNRPRQESGCR